MTGERFIFEHRNKSLHTGFVIGFKLFDHAFVGWLGYGKPVWWKPRFSGRGVASYGCGFGWLLLCFRIQVFEIEIE